MSETAGPIGERVPRLADRAVHAALESPVDGSAGRSVLLIGPGELPDATQLGLHTAAARVIRLSEPSDGDIRTALSERVDSVIVISRDDAVALRLALIVEYVRPGVPLIVTVHSRIVAAQLQRAVDNIHVTSMAKIVAPTLAASRLDDRLLWMGRTAEGFCAVRADDDGPQLVAVKALGPRRGQRLLANLVSLIRPFEPSARILTLGAFGFLLILVVDTVATVLVLGLSPVDAFYAVTKVIVTVGPNQAIDQSLDWFKVFSAVCMLAALAFTALFTAGVVDRLLGRRPTSVLGSGVVPRKDHVVVVGSLRRARALAAVTSHEVENISISVAALGMHENLRTILRAGRGEVTNETRPLFSIGVVRDVYRIGGTLLAAVALGSNATEAFLHEHPQHMRRRSRSRVSPNLRDLGRSAGVVGCGFSWGCRTGHPWR